MSHEKEELKKEFELERMILFSDAVFAISITLLIIEIKFPEVEKGASSQDIVHAFKPVIVRFLGFILSFFFTGLMWARHLKIFGFVQAYDNAVIFRNLLFLFFIVCFPFSASGITEHIRPGFYLPLVIYVVNIACITVAQFLLCKYLFKSKPVLSFLGNDVEKNYVLMQSRLSMILLSVIAFLLVALSIIFGSGSDNVLYGFYVLPIMAAITRRRLRKYRPPKKHTGKLVNSQE